MHRQSTSPSDHLLRTLAAVPVQSRILHVGCGSGKETQQLARLGFDLYACDVDPEVVVETRKHLTRLESAFEETPEERVISSSASSLAYPDSFFDWVVAHHVYDRAAGLENVVEMLGETRRVLQPGGWVHCAVRKYTETQEDWDQLDSLVYQNGSRIGAFFTVGSLGECMETLDFAEAEAPFPVEIDDKPYLCGIYRKVDENTPA